jgi:hypothetical protein
VIYSRHAQEIPPQGTLLAFIPSLALLVVVGDTGQILRGGWGLLDKTGDPIVPPLARTFSVSRSLFFLSFVVISSPERAIKMAARRADSSGTSSATALPLAFAVILKAVWGGSAPPIGPSGSAASSPASRSGDPEQLRRALLLAVEAPRPAMDPIGDRQEGQVGTSRGGRRRSVTRDNTIRIFEQRRREG